MDSVFTMLKEAREAKQLSLTDVADATYINVDVLKAIEEGRTKILPQAYVRAFIREYATVVGLDVNDVMRRLDAPGPPPAAEPRVAFRKRVSARRTTPPAVTETNSAQTSRDPVRQEEPPVDLPAVNPESREGENSDGERIAASRLPDPVPAAENTPSEPPEETYEPALPAGPPPPPAPPAPPRDLTGLIQKAAIVVALAVVGVVIWNIMAIEKPKTQQIPFQNVIKENEEHAAGPRQQDSTGVPGLQVAGRDSLTLEARTTDSVWVQLVIDNGSPREYIFRPNFRSSWKAAEKFVVTIGNAAAVQLTLNKKELGTLGKKGAVVQRLELTRRTLNR